MHTTLPGAYAAQGAGGAALLADPHRGGAARRA